MALTRTAQHGCAGRGTQGNAGTRGVPQLNFSIRTAGIKWHPEQQVTGPRVSSGEVSTLWKSLGSPGHGVLSATPTPLQQGPLQSSCPPRG